MAAKFITSILITIFSMSASFAFAGELSQAGLNEAAMQQFTLSEARLEATLLQLKKELAPNRQSLLRSAQDA